jgi:hypothetical protein
MWHAHSVSLFSGELQVALRMLKQVAQALEIQTERTGRNIARPRDVA